MTRRPSHADANAAFDLKMGLFLLVIGLLLAGLSLLPIFTPNGINPERLQEGRDLLSLLAFIGFSIAIAGGLILNHDPR